MANFIYNEAKNQILLGGIDFSSDDIRVLLVMSNTTADTEDDKDTLDDFTTLDEYDGANYGRAELANEAVNEDAGNDRAEFDADNVTFSTLGVGTRQCQAAIVYKHVGADNANIPIVWVDTVGSGPTFPFDGNGGDITLQWNAEGIMQAA